jgi:hypothetical protein
VRLLNVVDVSGYAQGRRTVAFVVLSPAADHGGVQHSGTHRLRRHGRRQLAHLVHVDFDQFADPVAAKTTVADHPANAAGVNVEEFGGDLDPGKHGCVSAWGATALCRRWWLGVREKQGIGWEAHERLQGVWNYTTPLL